MPSDLSRLRVDRVRYARIKEAFLAVAAAPEEDRAVALATACGEDPALRSAVEALLDGATQRTPFAATGTGPPVERSIVGTHVGSIRVEACIAEGGMGSIYRGFDERLHRQVALKSIREEWRQQPGARLRFLTEARVLGQLKHPGICEIHRYEQTPDGDFLVLEYIVGKSLTEAMAGTLTLEERSRIGETLADILRAAHGSGIVHRDLKPDNVMITSEGAVKVIDFGIAHAQAAAGDDEVAIPEGSIQLTDEGASELASPLHTRAGDVIGTPRYMSPEQARGEPATPASDIYSLGLVLHELDAGRSPYPPDLRGAAFLEELGRGKVARTEQLSGPRRRLVERMLSVEPADRPTAAEVASEIRRIASRPRRRLRAALAALVVASIAVGGVAYVTTVRAERARADAARVQAERLVNLVLDELYPELFSRERLDVATRVAQEVVRYFDELPESLQRASAGRMTRALSELANAHFYQGDLRAAREALERQLRIDERLVAEAPTAESLSSLADDNSAIATLESDGRKAVSFAKRAVELYQRVGSLQPEEPRWVLKLGNALSMLAGCLHRVGDMVAATEASQQAIDRLTALVKREPASQPWRHGLADALAMDGDYRLAQGDTQGAIAAFEESIRIFEALDALPTDLRDRTYPGLIAESRMGIGRALFRQGELQGALDALEAARVALDHNLQAKDLNHVRWTDALRQVDLVAARVLRTQGHAEAARERLEHVAFPRPPLDDPKAASANNLVQWAEIELELGHVDAAKPVVEQIVARGLHRVPGNEDLVELARGAGLIP